MDVNIATDDSLKQNIVDIRQIFDQVLQWIREDTTTKVSSTTKNVPSSSSSSCGTTRTLELSNSDRLQLYGLYKHITVGPWNSSNSATSTSANLSLSLVLRGQTEAYAKNQAWNACHALSMEQAIEKYLTILATAAPNHWIGCNCQEILKKMKVLRSVRCSVIDTSTTSQQEKGGESASAISPNAGEAVKEKGSAGVALVEVKEKEPHLPTTTFSLWDTRPMIPRGRLDISYTDLAFGLKDCLLVQQGGYGSIQRYHIMEESITKTWNEYTTDERVHLQEQPPHDDSNIIVGLSARTLFDLFLRSKQYPHGSEIIVSPPITVPGMMDVIKHHNLHPVPVDLANSIDHDDDQGILVAVDCKAIRHAVSPRTVAILVVHIFGMITSTDDEMVQLRGLCDQYKLDLIEDCAECFTGLRSNSPICSPLADLVLFSFGLIKTSTALGGGIAVVRNRSTFHAMDQLHSSCYEQQTSWDYLRIIVRAMALQTLTDLPFMYGLIYTFCGLVGLNFDAVATRLMRSFPSDSWLRFYRRRPSQALLSMLHRRLLESRGGMCLSVSGRMERCQQLTELMQEEGFQNKIPRTRTSSKHYYWLYPFLTEHPTIKCKILQKHGFDITQGSSQLHCIGTESSCPRAWRLMRQVIYIPISFSNLSGSDIRRLVSLLKCTASLRDSINCQPANSKFVICLLCVMIIVSMYFIPFAIMACIQISLTYVVIMIVVSHCLRSSMSSLYLDSSNSVAMNSSVLLSNKTKQPEGERNTITTVEPLELAHEHQQLKTIILTGATGFIGSMLLRDILLNRDALSVKTVIVVTRRKNGRSGVDRVRHLLSDPMFSFLSEAKWENIIRVMEGDVAQVDCGLSREDVKNLCVDPLITHVIHCAASVSFTQSLEEAAVANITSAINLQELTGRLDNKNTQFIHISSAFVHGGFTGSKGDPLPEQLFDLGPYNPIEVYKSMLGTQYYASKAMADLRFPNTYTFSKCIAEHLLQNSTVRTVVIRPSIVGPALRSPYEGWAGQRPNTLVAAACLYFAYQWNLWCFGPFKVPCIPVDILSRYVISKCFTDDADASTEVESLSSDESFEKVNKIPSDSDCSESQSHNMYRIHNAAWNSASPDSTSFTWVDYGVAVTQSGAVVGAFSRPTAYLGLLMACRFLPHASLTLDQFQQLHRILVQYPYRLAINALDWMGLADSSLKKLESYLDLPVLFYPFMNRHFSFQSDLTAPSTLNGQQYALSCVSAVKDFMRGTGTNLVNSTRNGSSDANETNLITFAGAMHQQHITDLFWALTQPRGGYVTRLMALVLSKIIRRCLSRVTVDMISFSAAIQEIRKINGPVVIVLAPTHRSFFDFLLLSFLLFSLPELQIDLPIIVTADDFRRLPILGLLVRLMRPLFVRRGRGLADPLLNESVQERLKDDRPAVFEVFLEGQRSRDRRFVQPKTGFLRSLQAVGGTYVIVPVSVSYERLAEQESLSREAAGAFSSPLSLQSAMFWLMGMFRGRVHLGQAHISAAKPLVMDGKSSLDVAALAEEIQRRQQRECYISRYHIDSVALLLGLNSSQIREALLSLGCKSFAELPVKLQILKPLEYDEITTVALQVSPYLSMLVRKSRPEWANWLCHNCGLADYNFDDLSIAAVRDSTMQLLDRVDECVDKALAHLRAKGFTRVKPDQVLKVAASTSSNELPRLLLLASIAARLGRTMDQSEGDKSVQGSLPLVGCNRTSNEKLGFWGFDDSRFILAVDESGVPYVTMTGSQYSLVGRRIINLIPFIESETNIKLNPLNEAGCQTSVSDVKSSIPMFVIDIMNQSVGKVSLSVEERIRHGTAHSLDDIYAVRNGKTFRFPDVVVWPESESQVSELVSLAKLHELCLIPYGGGTNVSKATTCPPIEIEPRPIVSVDMRLLNRVLFVDETNGLAHVEAGITGRTFVTELARRGYTMGHEPDSYEFSTVGGWIATKASGMKRNKYGNIEDIVKSVRVVGPSGLLVHGSDGGSVYGRESLGLDLCQLMMGSEGCLGIVTSAYIRIWPIAPIRDFDSILFRNLDDGIAFARQVARLGPRAPASVRLLDNQHFRLGRALRPSASTSIQSCLEEMLSKFLLTAWYHFEERQVCCATISYEGTHDEIHDQKNILRRLSYTYGAVQLGSRIGKAGYEMTFMIAYLRDFAFTYHYLSESFETFAPWSRIQEIIQSVKDCIYMEHENRLLPGKPFLGCRITQLYHEGVCLYFYLSMQLEHVHEANIVFSDIERMARKVILQHGGSLTHHHGIGKVRSSYLQDIDSQALQQIQKSIKIAIDPDNIFGARNGCFASV